jgi:DNA-binding SARP family transcriptional activator
MSFRGLIQSARERFQRLSGTKTVLILHPQFRHHNALIHAILDDTSDNILYVTLPGPNTTLATLWAQFARELADAHGVTLAPVSPLTPAAAAEQFGRAVSSLATLVVVIAAFDNANDDIYEFVAQAARHMRGKALFMLSSRVWPRTLLEKVSAPDLLALLPVSSEDMLLDYLNRDPNKMLLEVHALGSGLVLIDGRQIDQWDGALPRSLFFYFIDRGMTTRDEVFATFWPELSTREATNVFHVTKRKISEILGVDLTVYSSGFYRISPQVDLHYDVVSFGESVQNSAVAEPEEAHLLLDRAIALHERDFLGTLDQPWAARRREELRRTYVDALTALARLYEEKHMDAEALGLYGRAFGAFPQREDLARAQMRLYQQAGQPHRALIVYNRLVSELEGSLGVTPSPETAALAEEVRVQAS